MYSKLGAATSDLLMKNELATFSDSDDNVKIIKKQCVASIQVIDKKQQARKKKAVIVRKTYDYPIELEAAVCWDILYTLRDFALNHADVQESWNSIFGVKWPELLISKTEPEQEFPISPQPKAYGYREKTENQSDKGFIFGAVKLREGKRWQSYYRVDDGGRKHVGYFNSSAEAKEAAYEAAMKVTDLVDSTDVRANNNAPSELAQKGSYED